MEIEIISIENIKPSSPTPPHLKTHKLSLLDQIIAPILFPLILYFPAPGHPYKNANELISLKRSLSAALARYHPLAGQIKDSLSVDCNDEGALFVVTKIKSNLSDFLKKPVREFPLLIPGELSMAEPAPGTHTLKIQVNYFECGGIAIGSLFLHKVTDGVTIASFWKDWAANARGLVETEETGETELPCYKGESLFHQNKAMQRESHLFSAVARYIKMGRSVMRRYVFDSSAISTVRGELTSPGGGGGVEFRPSRVEIVSALIWKCFIMALNKSSETKSLVNFAVNVRRKADPPLPETSFGNFVWLAVASSDNKFDVDLKDLVLNVRNSINKIDNGFVRRMQGDERFSAYLENVEETWKEFHENADFLNISSWCNFGLYNKADFGWGKPLWISGCNVDNDNERPFLNAVWLMDTREGDGVEAWVFLDENYVAAFDDIQKHWGFASIDPNP